MRITKFTHSCLRLEGDGVLVVDPGVFSETSEALTGADAVLITHEHPDHLDVEALGEAVKQRPDLRIVVHPEVLPKVESLGAESITAVEPGAEFTAAGFTVRAFGGQHAIIHPDIPRIANLGYLISDGSGNLYHPGDSYFAPEGEAVETLFVPLHAPWAKISETIDFTRTVRPERAFALHDGLLNDIAFGVYNGQMERLSGTSYARLTPGSTIG
ncbi:MBL fold metallo-hydrolase [Actinoplanes sp. NPDC049265]|uniref:MBL fold metallo-hydrolase n=1 Tax=Actinoplanes sp. NPDC049265 TaxID=3363902 RepID=UPI0037215A59